jgi:transposase
MLWGMNRPFLLRPLCAEELLELQRLLRLETTPASLYRRCTLVWQLAAGYSIAEASEIANLHYTNAHNWVKRFVNEGLQGLFTRPRAGRPRIYVANLEEAVIKAATSRPADLGLGFTTWSLRKLEDHLRSEKGLRNISRETVRRILDRNGLRFLSGKTWCESTDPDFERKKTP